MKTAVSLPDNLFEEAEAAAKRMKMTRSRLYAAALREYLDLRDGREITEKLNEIYATESSELDPVLAEMQARSVKEDW